MMNLNLKLGHLGSLKAKKDLARKKFSGYRSTNCVTFAFSFKVLGNYLNVLSSA